MSMPEEILSMESAFESIPGILDVGLSNHIYTAEGFQNCADIYFAGNAADLPLAMLRRTNGNLDNEILVNVEFRIEASAKGLKALEFLSWWVRDASRSGENLQIRSIGLPPRAGDDIQLGQTLRFWLEAYIITEKEDMGLVLAEVGKMAESLKSSIEMYKDCFI